MEGDTLVSVAMATYNGGRFLRKQLDSIYGQTYRNLEVVVNDDGSYDDTVEILEEYRKTRKLKFAVNEKNLGFVKNFEAAVARCTGDFIALADQDDIWLPHKIETLLEGINGCSLICSDAELIDEHGDILPLSLQEKSGSYADTDDQFRFFVFRNFVTGCTSLMTREVAEASLPVPPGLLYHDWWFALIASSLEGVKYLDQKLIKYRQHTEQDTGAGTRMTIMKKIGDYRRKKREGFTREIYSARGMLNYGGFTPEQREIIEDRLDFYEDLTGGILHLRALGTALKHRKYLLAGRGFLYRLAFYLGTMVR